MLLATLLTLFVSGPTPDLASVYVVLDAHAERKELVPKLRLMGARITGDHHRLVNALQLVAPKRALEKISRLPGVARIDPVTTFHLSTSRAVERIGAPSVWNGSMATGRNIRIAVIDTGVDYLHADFGGSPDPAVHAANDPRIIEPGTFPTAKVIAGVDLVGDDYEAGATPAPDPDPLQCGGTREPGHGTIVSSIAVGYGVTSTGATYRGSYAMSFDASAFAIGPGVAPEASLYAVKIFGCGGFDTEMLIAGLEWAIDPNGDGDFSDRPDIINLSFGTTFAHESALERQAIDRVLELGVVITASDGNDPFRARGYFAAAAPSTVPGVISVGGTLNQTNVFGLAEAVAADGERRDLTWLATRNARPLADTGLIQGSVAAVPGLACTPIVGGLSGKIALIARGTCPLTTKFANAAAAGAVAVLVIDNAYDDVPEQIDGGSASSTLPGGMITRSDGDALMRMLQRGSVEVTLDPAREFLQSLGPDAVAAISVRGPSAEDGALKPDLVAPCCDLFVPVAGTGSGGVFSKGTSLSAPIVAGAAALLLELRPALTVSEVKTLLMSSARPVQTITGDPYPVTLAGAGRIDVERAAATSVLLRAKDAPERTSVSFAPIAAEAPTERSAELELESLEDANAQYTLRAELDRPMPGVELTVEPQELTLDARATATARLVLHVDPAALAETATAARHFLGEVSGVVVLERGGQHAAHVPFFAPVRPAHHLESTIAPTCAGQPITVSFERKDSARGRPIIGVFDRLENVGTGSVAAIGHAYANGVLFLAVASTHVIPTPATYPLQKVWLAFDVDQSGEADHLLLADGYDVSIGGDPAFRDVLKVKAVRNGPIDVDRDYPFMPLNGISPETAQTFPFFSDVWVFPVRLADLEISDTHAPIDISIHVGTSAGVEIPWAPFTIVPDQPRIDATHDDLPISFDGAPIELRYDGERPTANALVVTLTGGSGHRVQTLDLTSSDLLGGALVVDASAPATFEDQHVELTMTVTNGGAHAANDVSLTVSPSGETITMGRLEAGEARTMAVDVALAGDGEHTITVAASADACTTIGDAASVSTRAIVEPPQMPPEENGCSCSETHAGSTNGVLFALAFLWILSRHCGRRARVHVDSSLPTSVRKRGLHAQAPAFALARRDLLLCRLRTWI